MAWPRGRSGPACGSSRACSRPWSGFCRLIGQEIFLIEPLFYHSAILYERRGCGYLLGREVMDEIHAGLRRGVGRSGPRSTARRPFASRARESTVRGRSWALHDGVGSGAWGGVKMFKAAGRHAGVEHVSGRIVLIENTFPGGSY